MAGVFNDTSQEIAKTESFKPIASTGSMVIAHSSLIIMACLPIFFGACRSISCLQKQKDSGQKQDIMSMQEAVIFPFIADCVLLGLYVLFKLFSKEDINLLASICFSVSGVIILTDLLSPCVSKFIPENYLVDHHLMYIKGKDVQEEIIHFSFGTGDIIAFALGSILGGVYLWNKHWIVNDILGMALAVKRVESLYLNNIAIGCTFLGISFVSDIFWVFATDVMQTVATSFKVPNLLMFPIDLLENGVNSSNFVMAGLGDIIIPGAFIALFLRFDESLKRGHKLYFYSSLLAYFLGLILTIVVMFYFKHGQPALLYLVPACIGIPITVAAIKGDVNALLNYHDHPDG